MSLVYTWEWPRLACLGFFLLAGVAVLALKGLNNKTLAYSFGGCLNALGAAIDYCSYLLQVRLKCPASAGGYFRADTAEIFSPTTMSQLVSFSGT